MAHFPLDTANSYKIRYMRFVDASYQKAVVERVTRCFSTCWTTNKSAWMANIGLRLPRSSCVLGIRPGVCYCSKVCAKSTLKADGH